MSYIKDNIPNDEFTGELQNRVDIVRHDGELYSSYVKRRQNAMQIRAEGKAEGIAEGESKMLKRLYELGNSVKKIAEMYKMPENEVERLLAI